MTESSEPAGKSAGEAGRVVGAIGPAKPMGAQPVPPDSPVPPTPEAPATVALKPDPVTLFVHRVRNRIILAICNQLGLTYAFRQVKVHLDGLRRDLDGISANAVKFGQQQEKMVKQLNNNTLAIGSIMRKHAVWEQVDAQLGRASRRLREQDMQAEREAKAKQNGNGGHEPAPVEESAEQARERLLVEAVQQNFERYLKGHPGTIDPVSMFELPDKTALMFRGKALTDAEIELVREETKRLVERQQDLA